MGPLVVVAVVDGGIFEWGGWVAVGRARCRPRQSPPTNRSRRPKTCNLHLPLELPFDRIWLEVDDAIWVGGISCEGPRSGLRTLGGGGGGLGKRL